MSRELRSLASSPAVTWQGWLVAGVAAAGLVFAAVALAVAGLLFGLFWGVIAFTVVSIAAAAAVWGVARRVDVSGASAEDGVHARHQ